MPISVEIGSVFPGNIEESRGHCFEAAGKLVARHATALNRKYRTRIDHVDMDPVEQSTARMVGSRFEYLLFKGSRGYRIELYVGIARDAGLRHSDSELAKDTSAACCLMLDRVCWQESLGSFREKHPQWECRSLHKATAFPGLVSSQRGQVYWEMMPDSRTREYEFAIQCSNCTAKSWDTVVERAESIVSAQRGLRVEDIGYIVPRRTGEIIVVGKKERLQKLPMLLKPVFADQCVATARLRPSMSESKGKVYKLASS